MAARTAWLAMLAGVVAACGAANDEARIDAFVVVGQSMVVELGPGAAAVSPLPAGASITEDRFEWSPGAEHEGEHLVQIEIVRDGVAEGETLRISVAPLDASVEYGGCDCGSKPRPPRPHAEALGIVLLAAYCRRRRRDARLFQ